jgi:small subunit ribosomal protein S16
MAVKIRLSRIGTKHVPFYRVVVVDGRKKRDGEYLDNLGTYDAIKTTILSLDTEKLEAWVSKGAILSDTVRKIYKMHKKNAAVSAGLVKNVAAPKKSATKAKDASVEA